MKSQQEANKEKIVIYAPSFQYNSGGILGLYNLAKNITDYGINCKVFDSGGRQEVNPIFNDYAQEEDINDQTIVIYPEIFFGNPLQAKNVLRLILCELGVHIPADIYTTWSKNDLIYHWNTFNPNKKIEHTNLLYCIHIDPAIKNYQEHEREGYCYIIRKGHKFHKPLEFIHPPKALYLEQNLSQQELIEVFNRKKYLISYDPYSFINFIAALCGCVPIVVPMKGVSKEEWLGSLSVSIFLREQGVSELKGIAYGMEEIEYAEKTLAEARDQQNLRIEHGKQTVLRFVNDLHYLFSQGGKNLQPRNQNIFRVSDFYDLEQKNSPYLLTLIVTWSKGIEFIETWKKNLENIQECEIIFIDNLKEKTDKNLLREFCNLKNIKLINRTKNQSIAYAKNQALKISQGYSVCVLRNDVQSKNLSTWYFCKLTGDHNILVSETKNELLISDVRGGFCLRSTILRNLGGWDEEYDDDYWLDIDLCYRAKLAGYPLVSINN